MLAMAVRVGVEAAGGWVGWAAGEGEGPEGSEAAATAPLAVVGAVPLLAAGG
jgi:hypothetical protein